MRRSNRQSKGRRHLGRGRKTTPGKSNGSPLPIWDPFWKGWPTRFQVPWLKAAAAAEVTAAVYISCFRFGRPTKLGRAATVSNVFMGYFHPSLTIINLASLTERFGWRVALSLVCVMLGVSAFLVLLMMRDRPSASACARSAMRARSRSPLRRRIPRRSWRRRSARCATSRRRRCSGSCSLP